jgi:hypothetical protein
MTTADDESWREAFDPVFRELGAALYVCQAFEHSLCYLLALIAEHRLPAEPKILSASFDFHETQTLGNLIKALKRGIDTPPDLDEFMREGLSLRNRLVHGYCPRNIPNLIIPKGRLEVIEDIRHIAREIKGRDDIVCRLIDKYLEKFGLSTESLKKHADEKWKILNFVPPDGQEPTAH